MADRELDARGLNSPLPILRAKRALAEMGSGETLQVRASDPSAMQDFEAFCRQKGHELLESREDDGELSFVIRKV
ncbi:MAG: sulfurtransferase TusA family protein [Acidiferrobacterales bacterium]